MQVTGWSRGLEVTGGGQGVGAHAGLGLLRPLAGKTGVAVGVLWAPAAPADKELGEANCKGYGHHRLLAEGDNTGEPLAWMLRRGSAGSNTAADHVALVDAAISALPPGFRRKLMITCDGAGASHDLVRHLDKLGTRRGHELTYSCGAALGEREKG